MEIFKKINWSLFCMILCAVSVWLLHGEQTLPFIFIMFAGIAMFWNLV